MASSEFGGGFVRAAHQRSSLRVPSSKTNHSVQLERARERALAAAECYHRTVVLDEGTSAADRPSADAYYRQKLRSGFIDLRNSYNEKRPVAATLQRGSGGGLQRLVEQPLYPE